MTNNNNNNNIMYNKNSRPRSSSLAVWFLAFLLVLATPPSAVIVQGFSPTLFQETAAKQVTAPSREQGVEIELPDFEKLFARIRQASPLSKMALDQQQNLEHMDGKRGLAALEDIGTSLRPILASSSV
jgi:hypothetical protein